VTELKSCNWYKQLLICCSAYDSRDRRQPIRGVENRSANQLSSADSTDVHAIALSVALQCFIKVLKVCNVE